MWSRSPGGGPDDVPRCSAAIERRSSAVVVGQQLADLPGVEQPRPPIEGGPPDGEGPAEDLGEGGQRAVAVPEQQQWEGVEQVGGRGLTEEVHGECAVAPGAEERNQAPQERVARGEKDGQPPRDQAACGQTDDRGEDVEPVGDGVKDLAELGCLVELAG